MIWKSVYKSFPADGSLFSGSEASCAVAFAGLSCARVRQGHHLASSIPRGDPAARGPWAPALPAGVDPACGRGKDLNGRASGHRTALVGRIRLGARPIGHPRLVGAATAHLGQAPLVGHGSPFPVLADGYLDGFAALVEAMVDCLQCYLSECLARSM